MTKIEDPCEHAPITGLHLWMVYMHDRDWKTVRVFCSSCARPKTMDMKELEEYDRERDRVWRQAADAAAERTWRGFKRAVQLIEECEY